MRGIVQIHNRLDGSRGAHQVGRTQTGLPFLFKGTAFIFLLAVLLTSCASPSTPTEEVTINFSAERGVESTQTLPTTGTAMPISDEDTLHLLDDLISDDPSTATDAAAAILDRGDSRFIAVFLELMRANEIGIVEGAGYVVHVGALERLSGQHFGSNWPAWVEWYGGTDLKPPPGFAAWKGKIYRRIDPGYEPFFQGKPSVGFRVEEIQWGGVLLDGIPALDNAEMIEAQADYLLSEEPVFGISINGDSRAYPLRILDWHEMANDVVGGVPLSLAYCTLCGAGIAFDGRASNGETYTFGSSGFLYRSNKLMYDRQTYTLWNQLTGEPVIGELVDEGITLDLLPVVLTSWGSWLEQHPDTRVLSLDTGYARMYVPGAAYGGYFSSEGTMFPVWQRSELLGTKDRIYALRLEGIAKAYPVDLLVDKEVVNDTVAGANLVLIAQRGTVEVEGTSLRSGNVTYQAGAEVRAYQRGDEVFSKGSEIDQLLDSQGRTWQLTEEALFGPDGLKFPRINGHLSYWFGWYAFFPNTLVYGAEER
jgi:hypothetical protein